MTISIRLPGWDDYHETHTPRLIENGAVLWIPNEPGSPPAVSFAEDTSDWTEDRLVEELIKAMTQPVENYYMP